MRDGATTPEDEPLLRHLLERCDACDGLALDDAPLDAAADQALAQLAKAPLGDDAALGRNERRVRAAVFPSRRRTVASVAAAASSSGALMTQDPQPRPPIIIGPEVVIVSSDCPDMLGERFIGLAPKAILQKPLVAADFVQVLKAA